MAWNFYQLPMPKCLQCLNVFKGGWLPHHFDDVNMGFLNVTIACVHAGTLWYHLFAVGQNASCHISMS